MSCPICGGKDYSIRQGRIYSHACTKSKIAQIEGERAEQDDDAEDLGRYGRCQGCNKKLKGSDDWRSGYCHECE